MSGGSVSFKSQHDVRKALLDAAGETGYSLDEEQPMLLAWLCEGSLLDLLSALNAATGTRHFADPADTPSAWYAYTTRNRQWKLTAAADAAIDAAGGTGYSVTGIDGWRVTADGIVNQQRATVDEPSAPQWPSRVWEYDLLPPLPRTVRLGTPLSIRVQFADYVVDGPVVSVTLASGGHASVDYEHHGQTADLTITPIAADAVVTSLHIEGYIVDRAPSASYTADDAASQALPRGVRAGPEIGGDMAGPLATARGLADHMVWRYADMPGHKGVIRPTATLANWLPWAFRVDLYDVVSVTSAQLRATARLYEVVGISERCDRAVAGGPVYWTTTLTLQERRLQTGDTTSFFTLDTSALTTGTDVLAY